VLAGGLESKTIGLHHSSCVEILRKTSFEARETTMREHPRPCRIRHQRTAVSGKKRNSGVAEKRSSVLSG